MYINEEIMEILADEIQKEIDASILFDLYKGNGWHPVVDCKNLTFNRSELQEVEVWLTTICSGKYHVKSHTDYIFEKQEDAMMFRLKWA